MLSSQPCKNISLCGNQTGESYHKWDKARPSMEACGIDVFQTVSNNGFDIEPLRSETEQRYILSIGSGLMSTVTTLGSMFEIKAAIRDLEQYLQSTDPIVSKKAHARYETLVRRFFQENENFLAPQQLKACIRDVGYFLSLLDSAIEHYYIDEYGEAHD